MYKTVQRALVLLAVIFSIAYPVALIGIAFNVTPPFPFGWAASALLILEACVLILAAMLAYDWLRACLAALTVIVLSTLVEQIGVSTGIPFGSYFYTTVLQPHITSQVPLAVSFAWVLVVFASYSVVRIGYMGKDRIGLRGALLGAMLATSLDLAIEPVAVYVEHYWVWIRPSSFNYYGVPLMNFMAWFFVAWVLLILVDMLMSATTSRTIPPDDHKGRPYYDMVWQAESSIVGATTRVARGDGRPWLVSVRLVRLVPLLLFGGSLFMFALVDLTHGYYAGVLFAALPALLLARKRIARK